MSSLELFIHPSAYEIDRRSDIMVVFENGICRVCFDYVNLVYHNVQHCRTGFTEGGTHELNLVVL